MKKYLRELNLAGGLLMLVGVIIAHTVGYGYGAWPCGCGMLLLLVGFCYKAFHWKDYERENRQNIVIILLTIMIIYLTFLLNR